MNEWRLQLSQLCRDASPKIAIISNYPEHGIASAAAYNFNLCGMKSQLFYSETIQSLEQLPQSSGIILIGGFLAYGIDGLVRPHLLPNEYSYLVANMGNAPDFGRVEFEVSLRPAIWIAAYYPWSTDAAVRYWIQNGGAERFAERVKTHAAQMNVENERIIHA